MTTSMLDIPTPAQLAARHHHPAGKGRVHPAHTIPVARPSAAYESAPAPIPATVPVKAGVEAQTYLITPDTARALLEANTKNRRLEPRNVTKFASQMRNGEWRLNGQGLVVSRTGRLLDGQHRCAAIIEAGIPVLMMVTTGVDDAAMPTLDTGGIRTVGQILGLSGVSNPNNVSAIARIIMSRDAGLSTFVTYQPTPQQILRWLEDHDMSTALSMAHSARSAKSPMNPTVFAAAHHLCSRIDEDAAHTFFVEQFLRMLGLSATSPALALRNKLARDGETTTNGKENQLRFAFHAWNAFRDGKPMQVLRGPVGGWTAKNAPTPH